MAISSSFLVFLQACHVLVFGAWVFAVSIAVDQPAWFMSGALGFTSITVAVVVILIPVVRANSRRMLDLFLKMTSPSQQPLERWAGKGGGDSTLREYLDTIQVPVVDATSARILLVVAIAGLPFIGWYMAQTFMAKYHPLASSSTYTRQLAQDMWITQPATTIGMLTLLSITAFLHLMDIVVAIVVLACKPSPDETELETLVL